MSIRWNSNRVRTLQSEFYGWVLHSVSFGRFFIAGLYRFNQCDIFEENTFPCRNQTDFHRVLPESFFLNFSFYQIFRAFENVCQPHIFRLGKGMLPPLSDQFHLENRQYATYTDERKVNLIIFPHFQNLISSDPSTSDSTSSSFSAKQPSSTSIAARASTQE